MSAREVWYARRFPVGHPHSAMAPVHWKGWAMFAVFAGAMAMGALGWVLTGLDGNWLMGLLAFVSLTVLGAGMLLISVAQHGDSARTVEDYRKAKTHA
jgi:hypothetical protein